jgi:hypothetical protein
MSPSHWAVTSERARVGVERAGGHFAVQGGVHRWVLRGDEKNAFCASRRPRVECGRSQPGAQCEQGNIDSEQGEHQGRHRRLDLRTLARQLLSQGPRAGQGAELREPPGERHRDQRHLLQHLQARDLPQVARRHAGRLHVLDEGLALHHQPQAAGDRGRIDPALHRQRRGELGDKLGPIVWQFMPTKQFDAEDFEAFLECCRRRRAAACCAT